MTLNQMHLINVQRAKRWHNAGVVEWTALEWAGAMCGEAGEAANAAKKLKRIECQIPTINEEGRHYETLEQARKVVAREVADTIIYGLLLMDRVGCSDPMAVLRDVFNAKSVEYGFPERW
jgi:hypothetical protein